MRILFVIHRFGADIIGGAERIAWLYAEGLAERGHEVTVATTTARDYMTWKPEMPSGTEEGPSFIIKRFDAIPRDISQFNRLSNQMIKNREDRSLALSWMKMQGPKSPDLVTWLQKDGESFDSVLLFNYLYYTAWQALPYVADLAILVPFAHDEWAFKIGAYRGLFAGVKGIAASSETEANLLRIHLGEFLPPIMERIGCWPPTIDMEPECPPELEELEDDFLLLLGRQSEAKNTQLTALISDTNVPRIIIAGPAEKGFRRFPTESDKVMNLNRAVSESEAAWLRQKCRASLHLSHLESLNLEALNALAEGASLLVDSKSEATMELIQNGAPGVSFDQKTNSIKVGIENLPDLETSKKAAKAYLERRHNRTVILTRLEGLLERAAG